MLRTVPILIALLSLAEVAHAQAPASSFAELPSRLKAGETVSVMTEAGAVIKGEVEHVSDTILVLMRSTGTLQVAAQDVRRIDKSTTSKLRGAMVGLGVGFTVGAVGAATDDCPATPSGVNFGCVKVPVLGVGAVVGLMGMGVGAAVGAFIHRERVVFVRAPSGSARSAIAPLLSRGRVGLRMQLGW